MPSDEQPNLPGDSSVSTPNVHVDKRENELEIRSEADGSSDDLADSRSDNTVEAQPETSAEEPEAPRETGTGIPETAGLDKQKAEEAQQHSGVAGDHKRRTARLSRVKRVAAVGNVFGLSFCFTLLGFLYFSRSPLELVSKENQHLVHSALILPLNNNAGAGEAEEQELAYRPSKAFNGLAAEIDTLKEQNAKDLNDKLTAARSVLFFPEYCYLQGRLAFARKQSATALFWLTRLIETEDSFVRAHPETFYYLGVASLKHNRAAAQEFLTDFLHKGDEYPSLQHEAQKILSKMAGEAVTPISPESASRIFASENRRLTPSSAQRVTGKLALLDRQGETVLLDELAGQVLLVHFWASWCPPCVRELPSLLEFLNTKSFKANGNIVPVLVTEDTFFGEAQNFLDSRKLKTSSAMYLDPEMRTLQELTGGSFLPATVLYDKSRRQKIKVIQKTSDWNSKEVREDILKTIEAHLQTHTPSGEGQ